MTCRLTALIALLTLSALVTTSLTAATPNRSRSTEISSSLLRASLSFTPNRGQWDSQVLFRADAAGATIWVTPTGLVQQFIRTTSQKSAALPGPSEFASQETEQLVLRTSLRGAQEIREVIGIDEQASRSHFFIGNDPEKWVVDLPSYSAVYLTGLYPGIDLKLHGKKSQLEYDFVVSPGADVSAISLETSGAQSITVGARGELLVATHFGLLKEDPPMVYQTIDGVRKQIRSRFVKHTDSSYGFQIEDSYDRSHLLVIDPVISYSSFLGGAANDGAFSMSVNGSGEVYVAGYTASSNFPFSTGAFDSTYGGAAANDCFVSKFSSSGGSLLYSIYLGGAALDLATGLFVDASGNAYLTGYTESGDFPTVSFFDNSANGTWDCFVTKLSPSGNSLTYSTYLGGTLRDRGTSIAVNAAGQAIVCGFTQSTDFPKVAGSFDTSANGGYDAFVTRLASNGASLGYSSYLGGSGDEFGYELTLDTGGLPIVVGYTASSDFPVASAQQAVTGGGTSDGFLSKFNAAGSTLSVSTYLGGTNSDWAEGVTVDKLNRIYLTGITASIDFPIVSAFDNSYNGGNGDYFIRRYTASGSTLLFSTFLGGTDIDRGQAIDIDDSNRVVVAGLTVSNDFPTFAALDFAANGLNDVGLVQLDSTGTSLVLSTFLGGSGDDIPNGVFVEPDGLNFYVAGSTNSSGFPQFSGLPSGYGGLTDAFVTKIASFPDVDMDGIDDFIDNCPSIANPTQADADGDDIGDACDLCTDTDGDGFANPGYPASTCPIDNCPTISNVTQSNSDGDGLGDACDACPSDPQNDQDGDGICGNVDNCPTRFNPLQEDSNFDGVGDSCSNTAAGSSVSVSLGSGVTVIFPTVTLEGLTELLVQNSGPAAPSTFGIIPLTNPKYYTITTTAIYTGSPTVRIVYDQADVVGSEAALTMQRHTGSWTNITTSINTATNTIEGAASTFGVIGIGGVCCSSPTGNVDCDAGNVIDIADLTLLVSYLFISQEPLCCSKEANIDGSVNGFIDIGDLTRLVDYLFISAIAPAGCL